MNTSKVVLSVLAGVTAGALLGVLFAPEKGSKTRKDILDKGHSYADELKSKFEKLLESLTSVKAEAEQVAEKASDKYDSVKKEVVKAAGDIKSAAVS